MIKSEERLAHERKAFEFMYETRMKRALPNGICADKEEGDAKRTSFALFVGIYYFLFRYSEVNFFLCLHIMKKEVHNNKRGDL